MLYVSVVKELEGSHNDTLSLCVCSEGYKWWRAREGSKEKLSGWKSIEKTLGIFYGGKYSACLIQTRGIQVAVLLLCG